MGTPSGVDVDTTLRTLAAIAAWTTVAGGLLLAVLWFRAGGARAFGPEDETIAASAPTGHPASREVTSFSSSNLALHGVLGLVTAGLVTYAAVRETDRQTGYIAALVAVAATAAAGTYMFLKWKRRWRPRAEGIPVAGARAEDRLPVSVVVLHGLAAATVAALLLVLLVRS